MLLLKLNKKLQKSLKIIEEIEKIDNFLYLQGGSKFIPKTKKELLEIPAILSDQEILKTKEETKLILYNTKQYINSANNLVSIIKNKLDNNEVFTKFECNNNLEPLECQKKVIDLISNLSNLKNYLNFIKTPDELIKNHQEACKNNQYDLALSIEKNLLEFNIKKSC